MSLHFGHNYQYLFFILQFQDNGYLILEDVFKPEECQALRDECYRIVDDFDFSQHPTKSIFRTAKQVSAGNQCH